MHASFTAHAVASGGNIVDGHAFVDGELRIGESLLDDVRSAHGHDRLSELSGSWAAALHTDDGALLISDRLGSRPLYYCYAPDGWHVSTNFWFLVDAIDRLTLNGRAVSDLLSYGYVLGNETLLRGIYEVPPGSVTSLSPSGAVAHTKYWTFPVRHSTCFDTAAQVDRFIGTVQGIADRAEQVIRASGASQHSVTLNLTGGRDSRLVAWMVNSRRIPFSTYTMRSGTDATTAGRVAEVLGVPHTVVPPWYESDTEAPAPVVAALSPTTSINVADGTMSVAKYAPESRLFVTGHVGGAPAGTLHDFRTLALAGRGTKRLASLYVSKHTRLPATRVASLLSDEFRHYASYSVERLTTVASERFAELPALDAERQANFDDRQRRFIFRDYLAQRQLGAAFLPLLDNEWLDLWRNVPDVWFAGAPLYGRAVKELFGREHSGLAQIPINDHALANQASPLRTTVLDLSDRVARRVRLRKNARNRERVDLPDTPLPMLNRPAVTAGWEDLPRDTQYALVTMSAFVARVKEATGTEPAAPADTDGLRFQ